MEYLSPILIPMFCIGLLLIPTGIFREFPAMPYLGFARLFKLCIPVLGFNMVLVVVTGYLVLFEEPPFLIDIWGNSFLLTLAEATMALFLFLELHLLDALSRWKFWKGLLCAVVTILLLNPTWILAGFISEAVNRLGIATFLMLNLTSICLAELLRRRMFFSMKKSLQEGRKPKTKKVTQK